MDSEKRAPRPARLKSRIRQLRQDAAESGITPVSRQEPLSTSFAQRRLWFLQQLDPGSNAYNVPLVRRLRGELDVDVLGRALSLVLRRHEALRTVFETDDGEPRQKIQSPYRVSVPVLNAKDDEQANALVREDIAKPFDLATGPLLRALMVRLADDDHVLALTVHHIAADGWSFAILEAELSAQYAALLKGSEAALPALSVQYADFAHWERTELSGAKLRKRADFWLDNLRDAPAALGVPTDRPRRSISDPEAGMVAWRLPAELLSSAKAVSRSARATLFMTLLCAFQLLLGRQARTRDVLVGTPIANRNRADAERLIGMFVNTVVLRGDLSESSTFRELLERTRVNTAHAFANGDYPFEYLIEKLAPQRDPSINPIVQVLFQLVRVSPFAISLPGVATEPFEMDRFFTRMDLELHVYEDPATDELTGQLLYRKALFDELRARRMLDQLTDILRVVLAEPDKPISTVLSVANNSPVELAVPSNDTARDLPFDSLPELLAAQVAKTPDLIAVVDRHTTLTYAELDRRANKLARLLRGRGVRTGELIGLCVERGADMIVAMVAVLKAGAAYVPLDPEHPLERTQFVLIDSNMATVVTQERFLPRFDGVRRVILNDDPEIERQADTAPEVTADRNSLAYAIYTSGSTGSPKAVLMPGICVVNLLLWQERTMGREPDSRTVQFLTSTFDYSVQEIFSALLGGTLVIPDDEARMDLDTLARWMDDNRITRIYAPTTVLRALLDSVDPHGDSLSSLRHLCQGGEPLVLDHKLRELCRHRPQLRVHNHYGPAESQLITGYTLPADVDFWPDTVPIGLPIDNTRIHLLDDSLHPVPDGIPGQICVSGIGLAQGYLARPELTEQRFVTNDVEFESRMYLTGDLASRSSDGNLHFLGRLDDQVKIRGIRVEPGEIEAVLAEHESVSQVAVAVREDPRGGTLLVAYVVLDTTSEDTLVELRGHVEARLPGYMAPAAFVALAKLPLTTSGKVDRRALPAPDGRVLALPAPVAPRNPAESTVSRIYADVLNVAEVGVHDDFFALGGHSMLATRVISRIRAELGAEVSVRALFDARTPARLAQLTSTAPASDTPRITPRRTTGPVPVSLAQEQALWSASGLADLGAHIICPYGFLLRGELDSDLFDRALTRLVERHESLRTTFREDGAGFVQIVGPPVTVNAEILDATGSTSTDRDAAVARIMQDQLDKPFDLTGDVLLRAVLVKTDEGEHVLLLMLHHIVGDGWSYDILVRELSAMYSELAGGPAAELPALGIQYADFSEWEREAMSGPVLAEHHRYWQQQLSGAVALELPSARPRKQVSPLGEVVLWTVSPETTALARNIASAEGATLYETLLGAFMSTAARLSGLHDILVITPFADRGRPEIDDIVGLFAKLAALRVDFSDGPEFHEVLRRVHTAVLGAHAHQALSYPAIRAKSPDLPPTLVLFQLISALSTAPEMHGIVVDQVPVTADLKGEMRHSELLVHLFDNGEVLQGSVIFDATIFDRDSIEELLSAVESTLRLVATVSSTGLPETHIVNGRVRS